ncbi:type II secretion system F family protein [Selenomonas montiformis]|uniref:type II secretion system F family protein n=1 Tax=Selenomonas montiformis TaxID=2652285 RepID=UPI003F8A5BB4
MKFKGIGSKRGRQVEVSISAKSRDEAVKKMKADGYENISVIEVPGLFNRRKKPSTKEISVCFEQLAAFQEAGESFPKSLATIADVTKNIVLKEALLDIKKKVESGKSISDSFSDHPFFPKIVANLIKVGETSGELDRTLKELSKYLNQVTAIEKGVSSAMLYPKVVCTVMAIAVCVVVTQVLPKFRSFYTDMHIEMPFITKCLYALADFLIDDWFIAIPSVIVILYLLKNLHRFLPGVTDFLAMKTPIIKNIMLNLYMFRFCKTMQILLGAGINIKDAMPLVADTMENRVYADIIRKAIPHINSGEGITSSIRRYDEKENYDAMAIAFLNAGEETNSIPDLMGKGANYFQRTLVTDIENFPKTIEPIMIVIIGVFVLALVMAVYTPILRMYKMNQ